MSFYSSYDKFVMEHCNEKYALMPEFGGNTHMMLNPTHRLSFPSYGTLKDHMKKKDKYHQKVSPIEKSHGIYVNKVLLDMKKYESPSKTINKHTRFAYESEDDNLIGGAGNNWDIDSDIDVEEEFYNATGITLDESYLFQGMVPPRHIVMESPRTPNIHQHDRIDVGRTIVHKGGIED